LPTYSYPSSDKRFSWLAWVGASMVFFIISG
jgi:hypothetical protein